MAMSSTKRNRRACMSHTRRLSSIDQRLLY
jgi:hypothetical protein